MPAQATRTSTRASAPRKCTISTRPSSPAPWTASASLVSSIVMFSGRTSTVEASVAEPSSSGTRWPNTTASSPLAIPGRRLVRPMKVATYSVPGRRYSVCGAAICSMRPWFITPMRSATARASSWSWVTNTVVVPASSWMRRISSRSCTRTLASNADSGSSSSSTRGFTASARARATRCCWPPDICCVYFFAWSASPTSSSFSMAWRRRSARSTPRISRPNSTFCNAVMCGNSE